MIRHHRISVGPFPRGFHIITNEIYSAIPLWPEQGMLHVFIQHTSAALCINENADPTVLSDFELFFDRLAPESMEGIQHDMEGPDDMPAHIKSVIAGSSIHIPIVDSRPALGVWQGIYLCEFRNRARKRDLIISVIS